MNAPFTAIVLAARRAFTLLEVMIGILILALALLGLGAVIPVVVRSQKAAGDVVQGVIVANGAAAYLAGRGDLNRLHTTGASPGPNDRMGWGVWLLDRNWSPDAVSVGGFGPDIDAYLWEELTTGTGGGGDYELDLVTGLFRLQYSASDPFVPAAIPVADRLWPARGSIGVDPQYVWDVIGRRVPTRAGEPRRLQVAVFVRRIDSGVRVPSGTIPGTTPPRPWSLYEVLAWDPSQLPPGAKRVPVAVSPGTNPLPTNTGVGDYSGPMTVRVTFDPQRRDRLTLDAGQPPPTPAHRELVRRPGQKLVDNLGNIYTVSSVDDRDPSGDTVVVSPPVPGWVRGPTSPGLPVESSLRQVAFTPQVPAHVAVFTFTPLDPK